MSNFQAKLFFKFQSFFFVTNMGMLVKLTLNWYSKNFNDKVHIYFVQKWAEFLQNLNRNFAPFKFRAFLSFNFCQFNHERSQKVAKFE